MNAFVWIICHPVLVLVTPLAELMLLFHVFIYFVFALGFLSDTARADPHLVRTW